MILACGIIKICFIILKYYLTGRSALMFYYTCDNCHFTFESDKEEYTCPECKKSQINHKFGSAIIQIFALRQANEKERDLYIAKMGKPSDIPSVRTDSPLTLFCNLENSGIVFSKIGKSEECNYSKGEKYPYKLGLTPFKPSNSFTFEPINIVYKYIHYGDNLAALFLTSRSTIFIVYIPIRTDSVFFL